MVTPREIIDACVFKFLNKSFEPKPVTLTVPKKQLFVLSFMGNMSGVIKTGLSKALQKHLPFCKLWVIFKSINRHKSYFNFKDVLPEPLWSCQIYKLTCGSCSASYTGKTLGAFESKGFGTSKCVTPNRRDYQRYPFYLRSWPYARMWPYSYMGWLQSTGERVKSLALGD